MKCKLRIATVVIGIIEMLLSVYTQLMKVYVVFRLTRVHFLVGTHKGENCYEKESIFEKNI